MRFAHGSRFILLLSGALGLGWLSARGPAPVLAQTAFDAVADNKALAQAAYEKGRAAEKSGQWQTAYLEYRAAIALHPDPRFQAALGKAALQLGKPSEAARALQRVADDPAAKKALSRAAMDEVRSNLAAALLKVGKLQLNGPDGAEAWIDGTLAGSLPLKEAPFVDAGERDIELRRDGNVIASLHVTITAGKTEVVKLEEGDGITPAPTASASVAPPAPSATVQAAPSSKPTATAAVTSAPIVAGPRPDQGGPSWAGVLALSGVAVAAIAAGAGLWIIADGKGAEAKQKFDALPSLPPGPCGTPACREIHDALSAQASLQTGAIVAWGVGAAALAGAGAVWLLTAKSPDKNARSASRPSLSGVAPVITEGSAGLVLKGAW